MGESGFPLHESHKEHERSITRATTLYIIAVIGLLSLLISYLVWRLFSALAF